MEEAVVSMCYKVEEGRCLGVEDLEVILNTGKARVGNSDFGVSSFPAKMRSVLTQPSIK